MKAIVWERYGPPEVLQLRDLSMPSLAEKEVLVKVYAASANALDWRRVRGSPFLVRMIEGLRRPKRPRLGVDVAGRVEALGKGASEFHVGDDVFGLAQGAFAEYVAAEESEIVLKPPSVSYEAAAASGIAAITALQAIRDRGKVRPGLRVLVNGAGGGVGTFAVQVAKAYGAEVTAVSAAGNFAQLRSIGADHLVDYDREDFTRSGQRYDVILDMHPTQPISGYVRALNPAGVCITLGFGGILRLIAVSLRGKIVSWTRGKTITFMVAKPTKKDLESLRDLLASGKLVPVIDRRYTLAGVPNAIRYLETGHARGKLVITVNAGGLVPAPPR